MEDKLEIRNTPLSHDDGTNNRLAGLPTTIFEGTAQANDASFQLNRLLNFNVEVDQKEFLGSEKVLNFSIPQSPIPSEVESAMFLSNKKLRPVRDPMSHRIIEKRRRDRMNSCLADLSQLIPSPYLKQGQGRIEKTEIIEMAIKHMRQLQTRLQVFEGGESLDTKPCCVDTFCQGYRECNENVATYLGESLGVQATETQNMYKYLDAKLEIKRATLPESCICRVGTDSKADVILPSSQQPKVDADLLSLMIKQSPTTCDDVSAPASVLQATAGVVRAEQVAAGVQAAQAWLGSGRVVTSLAPATTPRQRSSSGDRAGNAIAMVSAATQTSNCSTQLIEPQQQPQQQMVAAPTAQYSSMTSSSAGGQQRRYDDVTATGAEARRPATGRSPACSETSTSPVINGDYYFSGARGEMSDLSVRAEKRRRLCAAAARGADVREEDSGVESSRCTTDNNSSRYDSEAPYNFKKDIKWRFTTADAADRSKEFSRELERDGNNAAGGGGNNRGFKDPLPPQSNCSGDWTSSVYSGNNSNGNGTSRSDSNGSSGRNGDCSSASTGYCSNGRQSPSDTSLNDTVPAFALHPTGVFYISMVLPVSQVMPFMKNHRSMGICHPVSIPVSFTGPFHMGIPQVDESQSSSGTAGNGMENKYELPQKTQHKLYRHSGSNRRSHGEYRKASHAWRQSSHAHSNNR